MQRQATPTPSPKQRKVFIGTAIAAAIVIALVVAGLVYFRQIKTDNAGNRQNTQQSHRTYSLNLMEGMTYNSGQPTELMFDIRDQNNKVLKDFDTVHDKQMHLIVVRKDRSYFQHVHPNFDKNSGMFAITNFTFPTDGGYRVFADFTASDAQKDDMGMKLASTPYKDVKVGSGTYTAQPLGDDRLTSDVNGFTTRLSLMGDDTPNPQAYAGVTLTLGVNIDKNGAPYKNLQPYLGALGHMVVLGPNLEFIHAHPMTEDVNNQTGLIIFGVTFPDPGQYKIYLQTRADGQVNTTDYNYTILPNPSNQSNNMNMEHMGH
jgi:hypothetical protein